MEHLQMLLARSELHYSGHLLVNEQKKRLARVDRKLLQQAPSFNEAIQKTADLNSWRVRGGGEDEEAEQGGCGKEIAAHASRRDSEVSFQGWACLLTLSPDCAVDVMACPVRRDQKGADCRAVKAHAASCRRQPAIPN